MCKSKLYIKIKCVYFDIETSSMIKNYTYCHFFENHLPKYKLKELNYFLIQLDLADDNIFLVLNILAKIKPLNINTRSVNILLDYKWITGLESGSRYF